MGMPTCWITWTIIKTKTEAIMMKREMPPVHPGSVLKEMYMEPLGISVTELADNIGVVRRTVSLLVNEHSGVSAEMALRLSKAFGTSPELWLNMQQRYDLWNAGNKVALTAIRHFTIRKPGARAVKAATATKDQGTVSRKPAVVKPSQPKETAPRH